MDVDLNRSGDFRCARRVVAAALLAWLGAGDARLGGDENWSRFRGPNGSGVAEGVEFPAKWTDDDYLWRVALPGKGHSSPIGWRARVFVTASDAEAGEVTLAALDAATGETLWTSKFESPGYQMHLSNSLASSTPAADAERVYVAWVREGALNVAAVDHNGAEVWRRELGPVSFNHGFGSSPIVVDDLVVVPCDCEGESFVTALDARSGKVRWRQTRAPGVDSYATPAVWQTDAGAKQIIVESTAEGMAALDPRDGQAVWKLPDAFPARCVGSPVVAEGLVIATSGQGGNGRSFAAVKPPVGAEEPTVAYELDRSIPQSPTPVAFDGLLFVVSDRGVVTCCDLATGKLRWTERVGGNYFASPVVAGGKLYCLAADGAVTVLAAGDKFEELGRSQMGETCEATPAIHGGRMYLRTEGSLACLAGK